MGRGRAIGAACAGTNLSEGSALQILRARGGATLRRRQHLPHRLLRHGAAHRRDCARLHGRQHARAAAAARAHQGQLGDSVLAPGRFHTGVHHGAGARVAAAARVRQARRQVRGAVVRRRGVAPRVGAGHLRVRGRRALRAGLPDRGRRRPRRGAAVRHAAGGRGRRHAHDGAVGVRDRAGRQGEAVADVPGEHGAQL
ncbi:hypothetical protein FGB62_9g40 [Gracilaria domingensis]|nr:hypothetical protein FGB62_9g40 [Gracilaria domingensis]